jgi:hypothetical protein
MPDRTDLLVVGAGPYAYSAAAFARDNGIETRIVGHPMDFWRRHMPGDMFLRSGPDWHLDGTGKHTFEAFFEDRGLRPEDFDPIPISVFLDYTDWFRERKRLDLDERLVTGLTKPNDALQQRMVNTAATVRARLARDQPASLVVFDVLAVGSVDVRPMRWTVRRGRLEALAKSWRPPLQLSPTTDDPDEAREWLAAFKSSVIGDPSFRTTSRVQSLTPELSKGLELDLVVLINPETFGDGIEGAVDRYVAMTRATQQLVILTSPCGSASCFS